MDIAGSLYPTGRIGTTNYILTPENIVNDMINMLPDDFWTPDIKVLNIFSKSGRFLMAAYKKLFNSPYLADMDIAKRKHHILSEQLYGITDDFTCLMLSESSLYGYAQYGKKNIRMIEDLQSIVKTTDKKLVAERLGKELGGQMEFDLVIGNPPYNNDLYLDFVTVAQHLSSKYTVMITPAKWQAKGGKKNEDFRKNVVPYMSKIVYYPCSTEIFNIAEVDGISIFLFGHAVNDNKEIINRSGKIKGFNNITYREVGNTLNNVTYDIVQKMTGIPSVVPFEFKSSVSHWGITAGEEFEDFGKGINIISGGKVIAECSLHDISKNIQDVEKINVVINRMAGYCYFFDDEGKTVGINKLYILGKNYIAPFNYSCLCSFETFDEAKAFVSFMYSKIVRFICVTTLVGTNLANNEAWRCITIPEKFDHIFTDQELYEKYNLTAEEINIIESVIKERK